MFVITDRGALYHFEVEDLKEGTLHRNQNKMKCESVESMLEYEENLLKR